MVELTVRLPRTQPVSGCDSWRAGASLGSREDFPVAPCFGLEYRCLHLDWRANSARHSPMRKLLRVPSCRVPASWVKMSLILVSLLCGSHATGQAQTPLFHWAKRVSGTADDTGNGVAVD